MSRTLCSGIAVGLASIGWLACAARDPEAPNVDGDPRSSATSVATATVDAPTTASANASASATSTAKVDAPPPKTFPQSARFKAERLLESRVVFLTTGEDGRIAILANENDKVVPHRFENSKWQKLELPATEADTVRNLVAGIYFGRDNRPRLMGYHEGTARKISYLRFIDGKWRTELNEIGSLGSGGPAALYGVLGEADPELVCRTGDRCLIKSRQGWKEAPPEIPVTSIVRAFEGKAYALTEEGILRAEDKKFIRIGFPAPWKTKPTGFWVGPGEDIVVVEPAVGRVHTLAQGVGQWTSEDAPWPGATDVAGPPTDRWWVGDKGLAHRGDGVLEQVPGVDAAAERVIVVPKKAVVVSGPSGVYRVALGGG